MLVVFLNNKLIACDTIIPIIKELKDYYHVKNIELLCFEYNTYESIKKNIVLYDAIKSIGKLRILSRRNKSKESKLIFSLKVFPLLSKYFFLGIKNEIVFLHFKALNFWPLKLFSVFFPNKTILSQPTSEGYRPLEKKVSEMMKKRNYKVKKPMGNTVLVFDKDWWVLKQKDIINKKLVFISSPHTRLCWIKYIEKKQHSYFHNEFLENNYNNNNYVIAFMLCWLGPNNLTRTPNLYPELFDETLSILEDICPNFTIFVKPHPTSVNCNNEMKVIKKIINKHPKIKIIITKLHPIVLSFRAKFFIANSFSTSFSTARLSNIPTIEYTDYNTAILKTTKNGSMRPDLVNYFFNRERKELKKKNIRNYK